MTAQEQPQDEFEEFLLAIMGKLRANRALVLKARRFGRVTWRRNGNSKILEVDLDLRV